MTRRLPLRAALPVALALAGLWLWQPGPLTRAQDRVFDLMLRLTPAPAAPVRVVDFGAADEAGNPWDRIAAARLVAALARDGAALVVHDVLYAGDCAGAPAAVLAAAVAQVPTVLAVLPAPEPRGAAPAAAVALGAGLDLIALPGAEMPCDGLRAAGAAVGSAALFGEGDAAIRRVPLVILAEGQPLPALALQAVAGDEMPLLLPGLVRIGGRAVPVDGRGRLWLDPAPAAAQAARTEAAADVLAGAVAPGRFAGAIVLIGSSLPQRGGLRPTAAGPLTPSVQIQADLIATILSGTVPARPATLPRVEAGFILIAAFAAALLIARLPPLAGLAAAGALGLCWSLGAAALFAGTRLLADPVGPVLALAAAATAALAARAIGAARAERQLRAKLGQFLPPAIVARLAEDPRLFRLEGESREVTALFTDLEGFSVTARALGPAELVRLLDAYFARVVAIVLDHGGMVDKIVGDSVHAYFNAPLDQPGHADAAIGCARDIAAVNLPPLGRTRIGIESGPVVLGDVGGGARIDYTAHGDAVNLAARLQEANKRTGTAICIGPGTAARASVALRAIGEHDIRSFGPLALYTVRA